MQDGQQQAVKVQENQSFVAASLCTSPDVRGSGFLIWETKPLVVENILQVALRS